MFDVQGWTSLLTSGVADKHTTVLTWTCDSCMTMTLV